MILNDDREASLRTQLKQIDLGALAQFMLSRQQGINEQNPDFERLATEAGWLDSSGRMTDLGHFICDPLREYLFWTGRDRQLPFGGDVLDLVRDCFTDKRVLEIGSGSGMNLFPLTDMAAEVVGVEPVGLYRQMCEIIAEREGITGFSVTDGDAENLPFPDESFDTILCVTAHQYFNIEPALTEIVRVLKPQGSLIIIGGTIGHFARSQLAPALRSPLRSGKGYVKTIVNTLSYMAMRRRVLMRDSQWTTAHPVYPSRRSMAGMIEAAGLTMDGPPRPVGPETCFLAAKPA